MMRRGIATFISESQPGRDLRPPRRPRTCRQHEQGVDLLIDLVDIARVRLRTHLLKVQSAIHSRELRVVERIVGLKAQLTVDPAFAETHILVDRDIPVVGSWSTQSALTEIAECGNIRGAPHWGPETLVDRSVRVHHLRPRADLSRAGEVDAADQAVARSDRRA